MTRPTGRRVRPIQACSLLLGLATALPPVLTPFAASAQVSGAMTPAQRAAALAGAQGAVAKLAQAKSMNDLADVLTNKSAGEFGLLMTAMVGMMVGFSSLGDGVNGTAPKTPNPLQADYDAFLNRYGLSDGQTKADGNTLPPAIAANGRQFLLDAIALLDKMGTKKDKSSTFTDKMHSLSDVSYRVISPAVVRLTLKTQPGKPTQPPIQAVEEAGGQWRIDLGDLSKLMKMSSGGSAASEPSPQEKAFLEAVQQGHLAVVKKMLAQNHKLAQAQDSFGKTALFSAVFDDNVAMAKALLAAGADVNAREMSGQTPLDDALFFHNDDPALLALLRKHGAQIGNTKH